MAELLNGPGFTSYNLQTEKPLNIDELIYTLSPDDLPLLTGMGGNGTPVLPSMPVGDTQFYWMHDEVPLPRTTLATAVNNSATAIVCPTGAGVKFVVGDTIRIDNELILVTAVNTGTDTLTVTRAGNGTTGASHAVGAEILGLGTTLAEGAIGSSSFRDRDKFFNYTQIFSKKINVTRTVQGIPRYGVPNELNRQTINNLKALWLGVEQALSYGIRYQDATSKVRQMGGLGYYITTNVNATDTWLTLASIEAMLAASYDLGGTFSAIMAQPRAFQALDNLDGDARIHTVTIDDTRRGRAVARTVMTSFGEVTLGRNRWIRKNEAFGINPENCIRRVFQPLIQEKLAKTDDSDTYMMVMEQSLEVKGQDHMARWTALDQSAALPVGLI